MVLSGEQINEIKKQLLAQIESSFPPERKEYAKKQVEEMNASELEGFLKSNNLMSQNPGVQSGESQCIFCSIIEGKLPSYKIDENSSAIAVLDIRPASYGHTLIIPKKHVSSKKDMPEEAGSLAKKISKQIESELRPKDIEIKNSNIFGHEIINIIPIYKDEEPKPLESQREQASENDLGELQKKLYVKPKPQTVKKQPETKKVKKGETLRLPKRIP